MAMLWGEVKPVKDKADAQSPVLKLPVEILQAVTAPLELVEELTI